MHTQSWAQGTKAKESFSNCGQTPMVSDTCTELTRTEIKDLMNRAPRSSTWIVAGAESEPSSIWTTACLIQKIAASVHRAMPEYKVETLLESRNSRSNTARVSVSELYQMKPIAFRWTGASFTHDQIFFGYPGKSERTSWEKLHEALRLIGLTSWTEGSLHFTTLGDPTRKKNQPSFVKKSISGSWLITRCHAYPHPLSKHDQQSWIQYDGQI